MTSFGTTKDIRESGYMPTFKVQGQVYHRNDKGLPNEERKFLQIYFMGDNTKQAEQRCNNVIQTNLQVVLQLQDMLHKENNYVHSFKRAMKKMTPEYNVVIDADKTPAGEHEQCFNAPTTSEAAVILAGEQHGSRDIVLQLRNNSLQRIAEMHQSDDALQYPLIFWQGDDSYHFELRQTNRATGLPTQKTISAMDFYAYRMML
ncbi:hypothetical protein Y1Q_0023365 [Alligator mississippiensis]|uniref:Helitron helicase-like domain-containing protein n=1 Tax=Alligator mississippiensis TaxID=8496 RepID=A0A151NPK8_ALLMI|nr:hypothetical protein Y1Q_0023365 [Alligator mississippiensis]